MKKNVNYDCFKKRISDIYIQDSYLVVNYPFFKY